MPRPYGYIYTPPPPESRRPFYPPVPHKVEFVCRVCGKRQFGVKGAVVCPGREGECRKKWEARMGKKRRERMKERKKAHRKAL